FLLALARHRHLHPFPTRRSSDLPARVDPDLFDLLTLAARLHAETSGAFDVTAGPLIRCWGFFQRQGVVPDEASLAAARERVGMRSEEHTSELQSRFDLVCRLLLE